MERIFLLILGFLVVMIFIILRLKLNKVDYHQKIFGLEELNQKYEKQKQALIVQGGNEEALKKLDGWRNEQGVVILEKLKAEGGSANLLFLQLLFDSINKFFRR